MTNIFLRVGLPKRGSAMGNWRESVLSPASSRGLEGLESPAVTAGLGDRLALDIRVLQKAGERWQKWSEITVSSKTGGKRGVRTGWEDDAGHTVKPGRPASPDRRHTSPLVGVVSSICQYLGSVSGESMTAFPGRCLGLGDLQNRCGLCLLVSDHSAADVVNTDHLLSAERETG